MPLYVSANGRVVRRIRIVKTLRHLPGNVAKKSHAGEQRFPHVLIRIHAVGLHEALPPRRGHVMV